MMGLNSFIEMMMGEEYIKKRITMEKVWNQFVSEEKIANSLSEGDYQTTIGTSIAIMGLATELLKIKKIEKKPKDRMFLINQIEKGLKIIKDYTEEELKCK